MAESQRSRSKVNYWFVPVSSILIFVFSAIACHVIMQVMDGLGRSELPRLDFIGRNPYRTPVSFWLISGTFAAITTMFTLDWGPKLFALSKKEFE